MNSWICQLKLIRFQDLLNKCLNSGLLLLHSHTIAKITKNVMREKCFQLKVIKMNNDSLDSGNQPMNDSTSKTTQQKWRQGRRYGSSHDCTFGYNHPFNCHCPFNSKCISTLQHSIHSCSCLPATIYFLDEFHQWIPNATWCTRYSWNEVVSMVHQRPGCHPPKNLKYCKQILQEFSQFEIKKILMLN